MQKTIFLDEEGDAWFERNHRAIQSCTMDRSDRAVDAISKLPLVPNTGGKKRLLEIGCGEGKRLAWLAENFHLECHGIEPSALAVAAAKVAGVKAVQGTADVLPYETGMFDIVVFGFCLYLCDREDLFRIAQECDRVLKPDAWVVILDFFARTPIRRTYHHREGVYSYKMDYRKLFDWHPAYTCFSHELSHHALHEFTDDPQEWVATSVLRKKTLA
jgi:SAM-dependent methyltransferase